MYVCCSVRVKWVLSTAVQCFRRRDTSRQTEWCGRWHVAGSIHS